MIKDKFIKLDFFKKTFLLTGKSINVTFKKKIY